jgi:nitroimidazol reductase NimA-like FMN-containing flavoprotein (pyridoxamine 5'-phosphate oxidase superfamily)
MRVVVKRPRRLEPNEIETLLALDVPARLATLDRQGFPHITPLWFVWENEAFFMTSICDRPHLRRLSRNPRAGLCIDVEEPERDDGQRPNRQVRAVGNVELLPDRESKWTRRITEKYVRGPAATKMLAARAADDRILICLRPARLVAVASV